MSDSSDSSDDEVAERQFKSLKKLAGKNFVRFAVAVQHVSQEVQLKLIEQLPEFRKLAASALESLDKAFESTLKSNDASEAHLHAGYKQTREALLKMLEDPNLSLDDKLRILAEIDKIAEKQSQKDSESKAFKSTLLKKRLMSAVAVVGVVAVVVTGGKLVMDQDGSDNA